MTQKLVKCLFVANSYFCRCKAIMVQKYLFKLRVPFQSIEPINRLSNLKCSLTQKKRAFSLNYGIDYNETLNKRNAFNAEWLLTR